MYERTVAVCARLRVWTVGKVWEDLSLEVTMRKILASEYRHQFSKDGFTVLLPCHSRDLYCHVW